MVVKERKQITGTTAQIQAYKGHEGQIVWDKEKKTFVGMSGTAGKNYPLAPKTYVDNEVAKVNTEVAKKQPKGDYATNTQLTGGLAGKEDKGTCLPLTGGQLHDDARISWLEGETYIGVNSSAEYRGIEIANSRNFSSGARIFLRDKSATGENEAGRAVLIASNGINDSWLDLRPDGSAFFAGKAIEIIEYLAGDDWGGVVVRYASGLMIISGGFGVQNHRHTLTFPIPFKNNQYTLSVSPTWAGTDIPTLGIDDSSSTWHDNTKFTVVCSRPVVGVRFIAIGKWK